MMMRSPLWAVVVACLRRASAACVSAPGATDVTLVTQASVDRLWVVEKLCERWHGPMALSIMSNGSEPSGALEARASGLMALCTDRRVAVVVPARPFPYPVNRLRNVAWAMATTSHVFLLDIDFWPSVGTRRRIIDALRSGVLDAQTRAALVVPALELLVAHAESTNPAKVLSPAELERQIPSSKLGLLRCVANGAGDGAAPDWRPTRANHWEDPVSDGARRRRLGAARKKRPKKKVVKRVKRLQNTAHESEPSDLRCSAFHHHGTTRFLDWLALPDDAPPARLDCFLGNHFEPFVVVRRCDEPTAVNGSFATPRFDERFAGYGKNKLEWIAALRAADYEFHTVAGAFAVHVPHLLSTSKRDWDRWRSKDRAERKRARRNATALEPRDRRAHNKHVVDRLFRDHLRALGLYDRGDHGHWFPPEDDRAAPRGALQEDDLATPLCAVDRAQVRALEDFEPGRFAAAARACIGDRRRCGARNEFIRAHRAAWRTIDARTQAEPFLGRLRRARKADEEAREANDAADAALRAKERVRRRPRPEAGVI
ncbi:hypothetical protein JL720_7445 [Aureococcus anophagefferens]|nr:hypothetical protein JL720_7445 [Aureococcus anophagefferens]